MKITHFPNTFIKLFIVDILAVIILSIFLVLCFYGYCHSAIRESFPYIKHNYTLSNYHRELAIKLERGSDFKGAEQEYLESLKADSEDICTLFNIGHLYLKINKPERALTYLRELIQISSDDYETLNLLGIAYSGIGKRQESINYWEKSLSLEPNQPKVTKMIEEFQIVK